MLTGLKNKFFILLAISLSVLLLGLSSTSCAYTFDDFVDYLTEVKNGNIIISSGRLKSYGIPWFLANVNNIRNNFSVNNYTNFILTEGNYFYFVMTNDNMSVNIAYDTNFTINGFTTNASCYVKSTYIDHQNYNQGINQIPINAFTVNINDTIGLVTGNYPSNKGYFNLYNPEPNIYFIPNKDFVVTYKNTSDVNAIFRNYSIYQWDIGETYDFNSLDSYHMYFYDLTNNIQVGRVFAYNNINTIDANGALYFSQGDLYVNSRFINYQTLYRLDISKFLGSKEYNETHYFVFAPRGATVNNGVITDFGSGDYTIQDSTNAIIANQESGDNKIINSLTDDSEVDSILSGEFIATSSGDIETYAEKFGFTILDNPFTTFLLHILESTFDALTEPNNVVLSADYKTLHFELDSDDFNLPNSPLKDFIRNLLIFLYIYGNYRFFNHLIVLIQTAKIDKAIATLGTDEFYDSDIM